MDVAYLGPEASFSHQAAIESFQSTSNSDTDQESVIVSLHPLPSFPAIFQAIQEASSLESLPSTPTTPKLTYDYALLPIENSTNGSVVQVLDLLAQCGLDATALYPDLEVCGEYYLPVHHCLFVSPITTALPPSRETKQVPAITGIRTLYTHPQVWGQCTRFLSQHFSPKDVERIDVGSTSAAAQLVARDIVSSATGGINAAISSKLAGERHNLTCLAENIEDEPGKNTTRFFVVRNKRRRKEMQPYPDCFLPSAQRSAEDHKAPTLTSERRYKSILTFTIPHTKPGALADTLAIFKAHAFNLTSIETRPGRKRNWQYVFFVECEEAVPSSSSPVAVATSNGDKSVEGESRMQAMLEELATVTESLRYLGRFVDRLPREEGE